MIAPSTDAFTDIELTAGVVTSNLNGPLQDSPKTDPAAALAGSAPSRGLSARAATGRDRCRRHYCRGHSRALWLQRHTLRLFGARAAVDDFRGKSRRHAHQPRGRLGCLGCGAHARSAVWPSRYCVADDRRSLPNGKRRRFAPPCWPCCTVLVLIALALAYFWQASRAREACQLCERMQARVDTALGRGRCGLWDWDLARGRIYWSDSMYEILGMAPAGQFLSFGDINALVHPQDGDLAAMAEMLDHLRKRIRLITFSGCRTVKRRMDLAACAGRTGARAGGLTPASRWDRRRHHRTKGARRTHRHGRPTPSRRDRDGVGSFRSVGRRATGSSCAIPSSRNSIIWRATRSPPERLMRR